MNELNSRRGLTKKANKRERDAAARLFKALMGYEPATEQINEMTGM